MNKKRFLKHVLSFFILVMVFIPMVTLAAAGTPGYVTTDDYINAGTKELKLGQTNPTSLSTLVAKIINVALGVLGLLAIIIMLIGGFKWMTAQGDEKKVEDAKKTIKYGIIGLVIILLSYVLVQVVIKVVAQFASDSNATLPL